MEMRVEELAVRSGLSVDTIRYYQSRGLLEPPRREGRLAFYRPSHLERLARVRRLQERGFTLATIARLVSGELDAADEVLVGRLSGLARNGAAGADGADGADGTSGTTSGPGTPDGVGSALSELREPEYTLSELADATGVPLALLKAIESEHLLIPRRTGGRDRYTADDVAAARAGLALLDWGVPLSPLLDLARRHHAATTAVAEEAVQLFSTHIRAGLRQAAAGEAATDGAAAGGTLPAGESDDALAVVRAYDELLPAVTTLVGHHFTRALLRAALDHVEQVGTDAERTAVRERMEVVDTGPVPVGPS